MADSPFLAFLVIVAWFLTIIWVHNDARKNSSQSEGLWALVIFFGWILGALLYVLVGRDETHNSSSDWRR